MTCLILLVGLAIRTLGAPSIEWVGNQPATGEVGEIRIANVPQVQNPYDSDSIRVFCELRLADGSVKTIPAYYYQPMQRSIQEPYESITPQGQAEWRARITPTAPGRIEVLAQVTFAGSSVESNRIVFVPKRKAFMGFVRRQTNDSTSLVDNNGDSFRAIGENLCWPGSRGTYDYDVWIPSLKASGANYVRLWCSPWYFGFETAPGQLLNYNQKPLWALDYTMKALNSAGIGVILCLDYHGMLESAPDYWGGSDDWKNNPYNRANGGPCASQNDFFTNASAKEIYKKRLRYLIGRYSAFPNLVAWEFWNEIDNVLTYLNASDVVAWHSEMAQFVKANDPYGHLVTTSLGGRWWPELWYLQALDLVQIHSYNQLHPGIELASAMNLYSSTFGKPVIIGEYGVDWRAYASAQDPYRRGFHQALWGTFVSTSYGCAQSWYWNNIHADNLYGRFKAMSDVLKEAPRGEGWNALSIEAPGLDSNLGDADPSGTAFEALLSPNKEWGAILSGNALIRDEWTAAYDEGNLNAFVHGSWQPSIRIPCIVTAHFGPSASMTLHLNSVSDQCQLRIQVNGATVYSRFLPNRDGKSQVNNEYNEDITVALPQGRNVIEISNPGGDWLFFDWIRFRNVIPAQRVEPGVPVAVAGSGSSTEAWVWMLDYAANFPNNAQRFPIRNLAGAEATVLNMADGDYEVRWFNTRTGALVRRDETTSTAGRIGLTAPTFSEDIFASIEPKGRRFVSGRILPEDWRDENAVPSTAQVAVLVPGTNTVVGQSVASVDAFGGFRLALPAPPGVYDLRLKMSHWLSAKIRIDASENHVRNVNFSLANGDVNGDNRVDTLDWNGVSAAWRSRPGSPKWNPNADLNGDRTVDIIDFNILSKNWRKRGE